MSAAASSPSSSSATKRLEGEVALVTGGATGIGEAIVRLFREHGAKVCIADIQDEAGRQLRDALGGGDVAMFVHCDVTVEEDVSAAVDAVAERFGALDVMVNNAGVTGSKVADIRDVDLAEARRVFDINAGSIVSLASVASVGGGMGPHAYTASKHAVAGLTKSVAAELGRHGVRVNCVSPYAVPTALAMPHLSQGAHADDALKDFLAFVGGEANLKGVDLMPRDVAEAVLYLASDEARYVSALNLVVDGGFTAVNNAMKQFED
ncbi:zerumbone synthase-like [Panicum miliaceum]|uniref:Zerumbone synthase-like n=1 Tax=Panicum miliaceum TaxID=4540 RepID=A0A3L6TQY7_PANMI|nr:zerumbone synthase-like [Panicum miliaceum]